MKRAFAALIAVMTLLAGCGKKTEEPAGLYYEASGIAPEAVLLTVDGREVPAARYFYWLTADCDYLAEQAGGEPDWSADAGGQTLDDYVKRQALDATVFYDMVEALAEANGCVLTAENLAAMDSDWAAQAAEYGGEDAYLDILTQMGLDRAGAQLLTADYYLYEQLRALSLAGGSELSPADGAVADFAASAGVYTADVLVFPNADLAAAALSDLEQDPDKDPATLKDGVYTTVTAATGDGTLPAAAEQALAGLEQGRWSNPVEAEGGVYLLRLLPTDMDAAAGLWFDSHIQSLAAGAQVAPAKEYGDFTAASFYKSLSAARTAKR
ncbi:MAG: peptidylprolyl isomerase [Oscillibacter sp.]|nr:peptidylprolyl isomerase [Oscillibacter sp.]MEA4994267.1 peptidylprolyl isomerase [Oscillibacter sp.]